MCKNEGEGCGVQATSENANQQIMMRTMKYMNLGKCCERLICEKSSSKKRGPPESPTTGELGGKCVKGIFSIILVHIHSKLLLRVAILA